MAYAISFAGHTTPPKKSVIITQYPYPIKNIMGDNIITEYQKLLTHH
jgi:hypothetical protein